MINLEFRVGPHGVSLSLPIYPCLDNFVGSFVIHTVHRLYKYQIFLLNLSLYKEEG